MKNMLSIDVEEIFHAEYTKNYRGARPEYRTLTNISPVLDTLRKNGVTATFFIVGELCQIFPELIPLIKKDGHEIAFHSWSHTSITKLDYQTFRSELSRFKQICPDASGFRAPSFSIGAKNSWAIDALIDSDFRYDSSIFPTWTPLYGVKGAPVAPYRPTSKNLTKDNDEGFLWEFPLAVYSFLGARLPAAGGFYLRLAPRLVHHAIKKLNKNGLPAVIFLHNWELDPGTPKLKLAPYNSFVTYHNVPIRDVFEDLLTKHEFTSISNYMLESGSFTVRALSGS